jgi:hypothetical protein
MVITAIIAAIARELRADRAGTGSAAKLQREAVESIDPLR